MIGSVPLLQTVTANARSFATAVMLKDKSPDVPCGEFRLSANDEEIKLTNKE